MVELYRVQYVRVCSLERGLREVSWHKWLIFGRISLAVRLSNHGGARKPQTRRRDKRHATGTNT